MKDRLHRVQDRLEELEEELLKDNPDQIKLDRLKEAMELRMQLRRSC